MIAATGGQVFVVVVVIAALVLVTLWGLMQGAADADRRAEERDAARRLRRELDRRNGDR